MQHVVSDYFYSYIDLPYFSFNEFKEALKEFTNSEDLCLNRADWRVVRNLMGKPRRFSKFFINQEIQKLQESHLTLLYFFYANSNVLITTPLDELTDLLKENLTHI